MWFQKHRRMSNFGCLHCNHKAGISTKKAMLWEPASGVGLLCENWIVTLVSLVSILDWERGFRQEDSNQLNQRCEEAVWELPVWELPVWELPVIGITSLGITSYWNYQFGNYQLLELPVLYVLQMNVSIPEFDPAEWMNGPLPLQDTRKLTNSYNDLLQMEQCHVVANCDSFACPICLENCESGHGVVLRECLHMFCR